MLPLTIIEEIYRLPLDEKFWIVEETLKAIKTEKVKHQVASASEILYEDYKSDLDLIAFTSLDLEHFYEAK